MLNSGRSGAVLLCVFLLATMPCAAADVPGIGKKAVADAEIVADVMKKVLQVNAVWLDVQPPRLSYVLTGSAPAPEPNEWRFVNRVWIDGARSRWETGAKGAPPERVRRTRHHDRNTLRLRQGITWSTALHAIQQDGLPRDVRIVSRNTTEGGEIVILETDLGSRRLNVGLGLYHVHLGQVEMPMNKVRLHIKLPEHVPVIEEFPERDVRVEYGPDQLEFDEQRAPKTIKYVGKRSDGRHWELVARFQKTEGLWLLQKALNNHDGKTVKQVVLSDVSTAAIDQKLFAVPAAK